MNLKILLILLPAFLSAPVDGPQTFRKLYTEAVFQKEKAEEMIRILSARPKTPLITGYLGAAYMIMAKHAINPIRKIGYFRKGRSLLEKSIDENPSDAELRMLRYSIQVSAPSFLGYNSMVRTDRTFLLNRLRSGRIEDEELERMIAKILIRQKITPTERQLLSKYL